MNFLEAVKSGRPFKRAEDKWYVDPGEDVIAGISREDVLAEDWDLEPIGPFYAVSKEEIEILCAWGKIINIKDHDQAALMQCTALVTKILKRPEI